VSEEHEDDFAAMFAASEKTEAKRRKVAAGDRVSGRVVAVGADRAFVDIGAKAEAAIDLVEFRDPGTGELRIAVGDQLEATVTDDGARSGTIVLKRTLGRGGQTPGELEQAFQHGLAVEGVVTGQNKGGYDVQVAGVRAFCPGSQIDLRRGADPASYVGQRLRFRVTKLEPNGRNIVVARRPLLEDEAAEQAKTTWTRLHVGAVVSGTVTSVRDFGAFVDLGGIDGLIHVSELGHDRSAQAADVLTVGQTVEAQVTKIEGDPTSGKARIGLSLRALAPDPWQEVTTRFPVGSTVSGTVRKLEAFGAFVELAPGIDGLVHVSKLTTTRRVSHPRQVVDVGDSVDVTIVSIDVEKRRIGLSMVEQQRRADEAAEADERRDTEAVLARSNSSASTSLGTFGDLLSRSKKP
jgi:small subunit ribosomal protein S1